MPRENNYRWRLTSAVLTVNVCKPSKDIYPGRLMRFPPTRAPELFFAISKICVSGENVIQLGSHTYQALILKCFSSVQCDISSFTFILFFLRDALINKHDDYESGAYLSTDTVSMAMKALKRFLAGAHFFSAVKLQKIQQHLSTKLSLRNIFIIFF